MGIDPFLTGQAFDPQAAREMTLALQSVCNGLCVSTDDEETTRLVAEKIVALAGHGMRGAEPGSECQGSAPNRTSD
jgi:hypothetical protein